MVLEELRDLAAIIEDIETEKSTVPPEYQEHEALMLGRVGFAGSGGSLCWQLRRSASRYGDGDSRSRRTGGGEVARSGPRGEVTLEWKALHLRIQRVQHDVSPRSLLANRASTPRPPYRPCLREVR